MFPGRWRWLSSLLLRVERLLVDLEGLPIMSYPYVGLQGISPQYEPYDAARVEQMLRDGRPIYLSHDAGDSNQPVALFVDGWFRVMVGKQHEVILYEAQSFLEFASWVAFYGCDYV